MLAQPLDLARLRAFAIPAVRRRYGRADCALYALSVGLGRDPLDARQLAYVDLNQPLQVLPTQAIVLGSPGFWLADPATGVDIARVLHGEQSLRLLRPLQDEGEVVATTALEHVVDKGAGKAALLRTRTRLADAASGALLAEMQSTTYVRGAGGFGGPAGPVSPAPAVPAAPARAEVAVPTRPEQALWYRLNGDFNPIHADPAVAQRAGLPRPLLHGLATLGIACHSLLGVLAGGEAARLRGLSARFLAPVFPGETVVTEVWDGGAFRTRVAEHGGVVLTGHADLAPAQP